MSSDARNDCYEPTSSTATSLDYVEAINMQLSRVLLDRDALMAVLGERTGEYLSIFEFRPSNESFSHGEIHFNYPDGGLSGVRLTVQTPMTPATSAERFGPPKIVSTNSIDTHHRERWVVGKAPHSGNRCIIDVSYDGLVQTVLLTREENLEP